MAANSPRRLQPLLFLGIVWSVGGAFLLLETISVKLVDIVLARQSGASGIAIPKQSAAARSHCEQVIKDLPRRSLEPQVLAQSKYAAWRLGQQLGTAGALVSSDIASPAVAANLLKSTDQVTKLLGVPELPVPERGRAAYALRDFEVLVQEDPHCVAAVFEARYSPQHTALFKFGAVVAVAAFYRQVPDMGDVFGAEIRAFGSAASVPSSLWQPLLEPRISVPAGSDLKHAVGAIVASIDQEVKKL